MLQSKFRTTNISISAYISLKKTPIKDKSGVLVPPPPSCLRSSSGDADIEALAAKNLKLENDLENSEVIM